MIKTPPSTDRFRNGYDEILWGHDNPVPKGNIISSDFEFKEPRTIVTIRSSRNGFLVDETPIGLIKTTEGDIVL